MGLLEIHLVKIIGNSLSNWIMDMSAHGSDIMRFHHTCNKRVKE